MFSTEYSVSLEGAIAMWLMVLALFTVLILAVLAVLVFVMVVLHRKPRATSLHDVRGTSGE
jgi:hypothetical protein